ncbi:glycosyltransferase [Flavobacterium psychrotolerans]|uniref:Glycosyl transferase n=1 Tax=Flavobacterium psychrotolerans TaxID=2169410 RepID=A0A2U1JIZ5_9FLAO|nr:glycosyltransferase [Flavobacterium psychrotolerans]PWA04858.1 glycosyl transferase [Flavobacterium psychrotolerans]
MIKFAGFIMTYERESILLDTIQRIFSQTVPPEKILIVDNSTTNHTEKLIKDFNNPKVIYHRVGYNSGPAGAAGIGLRILADEGYDWIYWGDDDDPPVFEDTFEILLKTALSDPKCGCVGVVGQFFNRKTGFINRVSDAELQSEGIIEVDTIAGGMSKIVNGAMILKSGIVPEEKLFYGFEELDFDIKIINLGYKLLVDKKFYLKHRLNFNRLELPSRTFQKKSKSALFREYYSTRNILYIYYGNKLKRAFLTVLFYSFFKQILRFKHGFRAGFTGFKLFFLAFFHFLSGRMGHRKIKI